MFARSFSVLASGLFCSALTLSCAMSKGAPKLVKPKPQPVAAEARGEPMPSPGFVEVESKDKLQSEDLDEDSGITFSPRSDDFLWHLNDSGGAPALYLSGADGTARGICVIQGVKNVDWEDLSAFTLDGKSYLLIADTGDNSSSRPSVVLHIVEEPALPAAGAMLNATVPVAWSIPFTFPDGPRDCEAVAVDAAAKKIILISKRTTPPVVYELPLKSEDGKPQVAVRVGTTDTPKPKYLPVPYGSQPTGLALSRDGSLAAVVTYGAIHLFPRAKGESWATALSRPSAQVLRHPICQTEAIALNSKGDTLRVTSEGVHAAIYLYRKQP